MIVETIARLRREFALPIDVAHRGPVPLERFFESMAKPRVNHFSLPSLTRGNVLAHLQSHGIPIDNVGDPAETLAGFLFCTDSAAWAYICNDRGNPLGRQRFTAAHELGHAVLHRGAMDRYRADVTIHDDAEADDDIEREANRFAVELLMPREICEARADAMRREYRSCPRQVLTYRLAAELLVSRQAMRYRLEALGVGDE